METDGLGRGSQGAGRRNTRRHQQLNATGGPPPVRRQVGPGAQRGLMDLIEEQLCRSKTVAVVGLSPNPDRPSHYVAEYLREQGFRVIPVNPLIDEALGEKSYPDLKSIPEPIDMVDIFRGSELVGPVVDEAIEVGAVA